MAFEHLLLADPDNERIALQTGLGRDISNEIAPTPALTKAAIYQLIRGQHPEWVQRKPLCGRYNCHGMTFANRRTAVYDDIEIDRIYADDGYRLLASVTAPMPGDVAIYRDESGGILHSAVVVKAPIPLASGGQPVPATSVVLSKWNDSLGEDFHRANDYHAPGMEFNLEFWTDRP